MLGAVLGGGMYVVRAPIALAAWTIAVLVAAAFLWMVVSIFLPARADRTCPACGEEGLVRLDPESIRGLRCTRCGHEDRETSAFLIAESEGPLEQAVLRDRARERARHARLPALGREQETSSRPRNEEALR